MRAKGLILVLALGGGLTGQALAQQGANKVHVSGSTIDLFGPTAPITILSTSMRTSANADLILQVTAECAIAIFDDDSAFRQISDNALAVVMVWVTVDGAFVPVATGDPDGKVVFCRREMNDNSFAQRPEFTTSMFNASRDANSFNWVARNVGNGVHAIQVKAQIFHATSSTSFSGFGFAPNPAPVVQGVVGRRTLVVEPILPQQ